MNVGSLVKFTWWSSYKAPSVAVDENGHTTWHELSPGDTGIILEFMNEETVVVLFSKIDTLIKIHRSMIAPV